MFRSRTMITSFVPLFCLGSLSPKFSRLISSFYVNDIACRGSVLCWRENEWFIRHTLETELNTFPNLATRAVAQFNFYAFFSSFRLDYLFYWIFYYLYEWLLLFPFDFILYILLMKKSNQRVIFMYFVPKCACPTSTVEAILIKKANRSQKEMFPISFRCGELRLFGCSCIYFHFYCLTTHSHFCHLTQYLFSIPVSRSITSIETENGME